MCSSCLTRGGAAAAWANRAWGGALWSVMLVLLAASQVVAAAGDIRFRAPSSSYQSTNLISHGIVDIQLEIEQLTSVPATGWSFVAQLQPQAGAQGEVRFAPAPIVDNLPNLPPATQSPFTDFDREQAGRAYGALGDSATELVAFTLYVPPAANPPAVDRFGNLTLPHGAGVVGLPIEILPGTSGEFLLSFLGDTAFTGVGFQGANGDSLLHPVGTHQAGRIRVTRSEFMACDLDQDGQCSAGDIDLLHRQLREPPASDPRFDVNGDGQVNVLDRDYLVEVLLNSYFGDSNLDGQFNTSDLVVVFQAGEYEDAIAGNSGWASGDWDGNGDFGTGDLVLAFQRDGFERGPRAAVVAVPEPAAGVLSGTALAALGLLRRRVRRTARRRVTRSHGVGESLEPRQLLAVTIFPYPATHEFSASGRFEGSGPNDDNFSGTFDESGSITYSPSDATGYLGSGVGEARGSGGGRGRDKCSGYSFNFSGATQVAQQDSQLVRLPGPDPQHRSIPDNPDCGGGGENPYSATASGTFNSSDFSIEGNFSAGSYQGSISGTVRFTSTDLYDVAIGKLEWTGEDKSTLTFPFQINGPPQTSSSFNTPISEIQLYWAYDAKGAGRTPIQGLNQIPIYWNSAGGVVTVTDLPKTANGASHLLVVADPWGKLPDLNRENDEASIPLVEFEDVSAAWGTQSEPRSFGTYLPGVPLDNMFGISILARGYDLTKTVPQIAIHYSFGGNGLGLAQKASEPANAYFFFQDMGRVPAEDHSLFLSANYLGHSLATWRAPVTMAKDLAFSMQVNYGAGTAPVEDLRVIGASPAGGKDVPGEGTWPVTITIPQLPLPDAYQNLNLQLVQWAGDSRTATPLNRQGGTYRGSLNAGALQDRSAGADYEYSLQVNSNSPRIKSFTEKKPIRVVSLPGWLSTAQDAKFEAGVYKIKANYLLSLEQELKSADPTGMFKDTANTAYVDPHVSVMASPDINKTPQAELDALKIGGKLVGRQIPEKDLRQRVESVTMDLDPESLALKGDLVILSKEETLLDGNRSLFDSANSSFKLFSVPTSVPGALAKLGIVDLELKGSLHATGIVKGQAGFRLKAVDNQVQIVPGPDSFIRLTGVANARLDASATLTVLGTKSCSLAMAQVQGSVVASLQGVLHVGLAGSVGVSQGGVTGGFSASVDRSQSGLGLGIGYKLGLRHEYLCGMFKGDSLQLGPEIAGPWNLLDGTRDLRPRIRQTILSGEGIFAGFQEKAKSLPKVDKTQKPLARALDLAHRQTAPRGVMEVATPVTANVLQIPFQVVASADRARLRDNAHYLDVVLVDTQGTPTILGSWDLSDWSYASGGDGVGFQTAVQQLSIPIPAGTLDPAELYTLRYELYRESVASGELVELAIQPLDLLIGTARAQVQIGGQDFQGQTIRFGTDTSGSPIATLVLANTGNGALEMSPPLLDGIGFRLRQPVRGTLVLSPGELLELEVELTARTSSASGTLRWQTNDPNRPQVTIPLSYDGRAPLDGTSPRVTALEVRSSGWADTTSSLPAVGQRLTAAGLDELVVHWSEPVRLGRGAMHVRDSRGNDLPVAEVSFDTTGTRTTFVLAEPLPVDNVVVTLDTSVVDRGDNRMATSYSEILWVRSGHINGDDVVGTLDVAKLAAAIRLGPTVRDLVTDLNRDGAVNRADAAALTRNIGGDVRSTSRVNQQPRLANVADGTLAEGGLFTRTLSSTDPDAGQTLSYRLLQAPAGATLSANGALRWQTTGADGPGVHEFLVEVRDNGVPQRADMRAFRVNVTEANVSPVVAPVTARTIDAGQLLEVTIHATDANQPGDRLTYALQQAPAGATINSFSGQLLWDTDVMTAPGSYPFTVVVTDDGVPARSASTSFAVTVQAVNEPPLFVRPAAVRIQERDDLRITLSATDANLRDQLRFELGDGAPSGGALTVEPATGVLSWPAASSRPTGAHWIPVVVRDNGNPSRFDRTAVYVEILEENQPPTVASELVVSGVAGVPLEYSLAATDADLPAQRLSYRLAEDAPDDMIIDVDTGTIRWTPLRGAATTESFHVLVTDDGAPSLTSTVQVTIQINPETDPPLVGLALLRDTGVPDDRITTEPDVYGWFVDPSPIARVWFRFGPTPAGPYVEGTNLLQPDGTFLASRAALEQWNGGPLVDGEYFASMYAEDIHGNRSAPTEFSFTYRTPIDASLAVELDPAFDTGVLGDGETDFALVSFRGTATPGARVSVMDSAAETIADPDGRFTLENVPLPAGYNRLIVAAFSEFGGSIQQSLFLYRTPDQCVGPDLYGMRGCIVAPQFHDIATTGQVVLAGEDNDSQFIPVSFLGGFDFQFYEEQVTQFVPTTNGLVSFNFGQFEDVAGDLTSDPFDSTVAVLLADLNLPVGSPAAVLASVVGSGADRRFILQWNRVRFADGTPGDITFQVEFYEASDRIQINYLDLAVNGPATEGATATVGVKGFADQTDGQQRVLVSHLDGPNEYVGSGKSILFTPGEPPPPQDFEEPLLDLQLLNDSLYLDYVTNDPRLRGTIEDASPLALVELAWDPDPFDFEDPTDYVDITALLQPDGTFVVDEPFLISLTGSALVDGTYAFFARATDAAGNAMLFPTPLSFELDRTGPTLPPSFTLEPAFDSGAVGDWTTVYSNIGVRGVAEPDFEAVLAGRHEEYPLPVDFDGNFRVDNIPLALGANQVTVAIRDIAGNSIESTVTVVRVAGDCVGPDSFGYRACVVPYGFTDIRATGQQSSIDSLLFDGYLPLSEADLNGFTFDLYGQTYGSITIAPLGAISFGDPIDYPDRLTSVFPGPILAAYWNDPFNLDTQSGGDIFWEVRGTAGSRRLIVQWDNLRYYETPSETLGFQMVLHESDGAIEYNYRQIESSYPYALAALEIGIKGEGDQAAGGQLLYLASRGRTQFVGDGVSTRITRVAAAREAVWADDTFLMDLASAHVGALAPKRRAYVA